MKTKFKFAFILYFVSFFIVFLIDKFNYKSLSSQKIPTTVSNKISSVNLPGKIIYQKDSSIIIHDLITKEDSVLFTDLTTDDLFPLWTYNNGYIFAINKTKQIIRKNLITSKEDILNIDMSFCSIKLTPTSYCDVVDLFPSPDGSRLVFVVSGDTESKIGGWDVSPNFTSILAFQNFDSPKITIVSKAKDSIYREGSTWFSDSKYFYLSGQKKVLDTDNFIPIQLSGFTSDILYPSYTGHGYLWFNNQSHKVSNGAFGGSIVRPDLMYGILNSTYKRFIPFVNFPVIARDFKSISNVIPIRNQNEFLLESDSNGKSDIFLTDAGSTFKKINPNNSDSYALISYLPKLQKILALQVKENRGSTYKILQTQLVTLDESNYSENIADINTDNIIYHQQNIYTFSEPEYFFGINHWMGYYLKPYAISPDNRYLLLPLEKIDYDHYDNFIVIDLISGITFDLDLQAGRQFYWLE